MTHRFPDLLSMLRAAVAEFGPDLELYKLTLRDDTPLPDAGYDRERPGIVHGKPAALVAKETPEGIQFEWAEQDDGPDVFRKSQMKVYAKRKKRWRETGTDEGRSTDQLVDNPNEALETETGIDDHD